MIKNSNTYTFLGTFFSYGDNKEQRATENKRQDLKLLSKFQGNETASEDTLF